MDYKDESMWLMQGDCLERMKEIPSGSVDMILCDPPYGTMKGFDGVDHGLAGKTGWDDALAPAEFLEHCSRVLRVNGALILFSRRFNLPTGEKYKSNVLRYKKDYDGFHPTQKPVALLADLIETYSNKGDMVLDFTMGSGTTGVACVNTGRKFIGIEMDEGYFNVAKDRILCK